MAQKLLVKIGVWLLLAGSARVAAVRLGRGRTATSNSNLSGYRTSFEDDLDQLQDKFQGRGESPVQRSAVAWIKCHSIDVI